MDVVLTIPPILITIIKKRCFSGFFSYFFLGDKKNDIFLKKTKKIHILIFFNIHSRQLEKKYRLCERIIHYKYKLKGGEHNY